MSELPAEHIVAYLLAPGHIALRSVPVPRPGPGEIMVRIERALAGGTDRKAFRRGHPQIPMPGPFGHRYAGTVAALGAGAPSFAVGQPIMGVHSAPCLACDLCRKKRWNLCPDVMKDKVLGAFAQYLCVPAAVARQNLFPRPAGMKPEHAALLEPISCVVHGLERIDWRQVESVLILGLGAMGLLFAQLVPFFSAAKMVARGQRTERVTLAKSLGLADARLVDIPADVPARAEDVFDCVLECTGALSGWQLACAHAAPGGQVLLFGGLPRGTMLPVDSYRLHYEDLRLLGSFHFSPCDVARAREFLLSGKLQLEPLIQDCLPLFRLPEVMARLERGDGLQYAVDPWAT